MKRWTNYINGGLSASSEIFLDVINPFTERKIAEVVDSNTKDVDYAVNAAKKAFENWKRTTPAERAGLFLKLADLIEKDKYRLAKLESENQGKTVSLAMADIEFGIDNLRFFAGACRTLTSTVSGDYIDEHLNKKHDTLGTSITRREPIGIVAAITPWNYPIMVACWKLAAVAVGNTIILKPSSSTPLTTLEIAVLAEKAGFPPGVINVLTGKGEKIGRLLASHPGIDMISLTGSTETGKEIMKLASLNLKKIHLELGGKAPFIVFEDAQLYRAARFAVEGSAINSGQDCTAAARIYVQEKVYEKFLQLVKKEASKVKVGDPRKKQHALAP